MKSRIIVAAIGIPLLYLITLSEFANSLAFTLLVSAAFAIAALELCQMLRPLGPFVPAAFVPVALAPLLAWQLGEVGIFLAMLASIPLLMAFQGVSVERESPLASIVATLMPLMYLAPAAGLAVVLRQGESKYGLVFLLIASVFVNDTGAYLVGRAIGRHKLSPRISPNKSIEGFVGGVTLGTLTMWYGHYLIKVDGHYVMTGAQAFFIGLAVALVVPTGDLFESLLKRSAGIKDSGRLLGEHGGMLDRIDALVLAIPAMYIGCFFVGAL